MRLFVAVELAPDVTHALSDFVSMLRRRAYSLAPRARISWALPEQLHVTSRFIGEVSGERAAAIAETLQPECAMAPFNLAIRGLGAYPDRGAPRVLWAGIGVGVDGLIALEADVSARLAACGVDREERPYSPHITLARVRVPAGLRSTTLLENTADLEFGTSRVDAITLFQSRTSPKGALYTPLHRTLLRP